MHRDFKYSNILNNGPKQVALINAAAPIFTTDFEYSDVLGCAKFEKKREIILHFCEVYEYTEFLPILVAVPEGVIRFSYQKE